MAYTDMERRILDMWPKYEDGEYVWIGDDVSGMDVRSFVFTESCVMVTNLTSVPAYGECRKYGEPFKRPAPKVLDVDGVEIKVGDTVWVDGVSESCEVVKVESDIVQVQYADGDTFECCLSDLTHKQPDSWERLEDDATMSAWSYRDKYGLAVGVSNDEYIPTTVAFTLDLIRRAKALAEKEAAR